MIAAVAAAATTRTGFQTQIVAVAVAVAATATATAAAEDLHPVTALALAVAATMIAAVAEIRTALKVKLNVRAKAIATATEVGTAGTGAVHPLRTEVICKQMPATTSCACCGSKWCCGWRVGFTAWTWGRRCRRRDERRERIRGGGEKREEEGGGATQMVHIVFNSKEIPQVQPHFSCCVSSSSICKGSGELFHGCGSVDECQCANE